MMKISVALVLTFVLAGWALMATAREPVKPTSANPEAQALIDKAWAALDQEMRIQEVDEAIKYFEAARELDQDNHEILIELAGEYFHRGNQMPKATDADFDARKKYFDQGYAHARRALELKECAGSHAAVATTLAAVNENEGVLAQAAMIPELKAHIDWIMEHDPAFKYGGVVRFWSRVNVLVPDVVVKMVGEDPDEIFHGLNEMIKTEPRYLDNYIYKAEYYYHRDREDEALAVLDEALKMDPEALPEERAYNRYAQRRARATWKEWTGKDYPQK